MEHKVITEDEFYERFTPCKNELDGNASFDGCMFETFGEELDIVRTTNLHAPRRVWTIVESDGRMYYESGYHIVNRIGYFITEEDYEEGIEYTVELEDLTDGEYQCRACGDHFDEPEDGCCSNCGSDSFVKGCVDEAGEE